VCVGIADTKTLAKLANHKADFQIKVTIEFIPADYFFKFRERGWRGT